VRQAAITMFAAIAVAAISTPVLAQYVHNPYPRPVYPVRSSIHSLPYDQAYDACFELALRRGQNVSTGDLLSRNKFIHDCLAGKIPF
jgi:hypothetical protein